MRAIVAQNGDAYVAGSFLIEGSARQALGVLRVSPNGQVCLAGSWTFEPPSYGVVGLAETPDGIMVANPLQIGVIPKRE